MTAISILCPRPALPIQKGILILLPIIKFDFLFVTVYILSYQCFKPIFSSFFETSCVQYTGLTMRLYYTRN